MLLERKVLSAAHPALAREPDPAHSTAPMTLTGYVLTYDRDLGNDVILPEAVRHQDGQRMSALFNHDHAEPIGSVTLSQDSKGMRGTFTLNPAVQRAREVYALAKAGDVSGLSIGFSALPGGAYKRADGVRVLQKIQLGEVSIVCFPMNPAARLLGKRAHATAEAEVVTAVKGLNEELERTAMRMELATLVTEMRRMTRRAA